jgi:non-specific serine/threonine protein kinase
MLGRTVSHYTILEQMGSGGMGVVYRAEDQKLKRTVALKFLPPELTRDGEARERFVHEAQAASALDHPNICTIYEIDQTDDEQMFIAMTAYKGETLKEKLDRGPLKLQEAVDLSIQLAQGLNKAHGEGIVHRDIKPANVMVTEDSVVKILDFGLAKLGGRTFVTKEGTTLGTAAYMSPEQSRGEDVDHRTDIWSVGVVLYQMLTGQPPFKGDYEIAVIYSINNASPEPLTAVRTGVPMELERIVGKALAKNPSDRYQHADDLVTDLRGVRQELETGVSRTAWQPTAPQKKPLWNRPVVLLAGLVALILVVVGLQWILSGTGEEAAKDVSQKSIAVLPFTTITRSEDDQIFAEGIHDVILTHLAKIRDLKVLGRQSVLRYRGTDKSPREIGAELGVSFLLEGTVSRAEDSIRVVAQLLDTRSEEHVWADIYHREYASVFAIQSDVAQRIAEELQATLTPEEKAQIEQKPTEDLEAYEFYLKGNYYWQNYDTWEGNEMAARMFEQATRRDPDFALAHARLSLVHSILYQYNTAPEEHLDSARTSLERAEELDPDLPDLHYARGYYLVELGNSEGAMREFERAVKAEPNNSEYLSALGIQCLAQREMERAIEFLTRSYELEPHGINQGLWVSSVYRYQRRWDEAEFWIDRYIANHPEGANGYRRKAQISISGRGDLETARSILDKGLEHGENPSRLTFMRWQLEMYSRDYESALNVLERAEDEWTVAMGFTYLQMGEKGRARACFDSARIFLEKRLATRPGVALTHSLLGMAYAGLGMKEEAFREGRKALELNPIMSDPLFEGEAHLRRLAVIHMMCQENDEAVEILKKLLSIPGPLTRWLLRLDPAYDQLRDHPGFKKLVESGPA